jgi:LacI family transcriptional regulator
MSTIYDVAKKAGVSKTTVSKILSGKGNVRQTTLDKVEKAIDELDYIPSGFAQGMRVNHTKSISVLLPEQYNYGYFDILKGIEDAVVANDYIMTVCSTGIDAQQEMKYMREMIRRHVDGIIFFSYMRVEKNIEYLIRLSDKTPVIVMDNIVRDDEPLSVVRVDGFEVSRKGAQYLIDKGRKRIAYIKPGDEYAATSERYQGYLAAMKENRVDFDSGLVAESSFENHITGGYEAARRLMELPDPPDAIMTATDMFAIGVVNYLTENEVNIPEDVNVLGFDNIRLCSWIRPHLSTISQNQLNVGRTAFNLLLEQIKNPSMEPQKIIMHGELVIRDTT